MSVAETSRSWSRANVGLVAALLLFDSLHFVFARLLLPLISPAVSVMYVLAVSTLEVGVFTLAKRRLSLRVLRENAGFFLAIGFLIAASTNINYEAVAFIDPGTASLLSQTSILFSLGFGLIWMRDRLSPLQGLGVVLAVIGAFVISFQPGDYLRLGALLVILSAFMYAFHAALAKRHGEEIDFLNFFFGRLLATTIVLFSFSAARQALVWPSARAWGLILLIGTVDVVLSRTLYYIALRRLTMSMHTIALTLTPIASILWSLALFGTRPTTPQMLGGVAVILGVLIVTLN